MAANIPPILTSFVGRKQDLAEVRRLLASSRLITLTGAAGCGKTRLALRVAAEVTDRYTDGIHCVELARLSDPTLVPHAVAKVLGVVEQRGHSMAEGMLDALHDKHLLLVLDNCEHILSECAQLVKALLTATEVEILATSREPLNVPGEMRYPVPPMVLPPIGIAPKDLSRFDTVQLFVERARAILPGFALTEDNAGVIGSICHRLDGLPLAIELASAHVNVLTVEQIDARLDDRFELLAAATNPTYSHHHTLRAAIDWSHDLLSSSERTLLQRLSVFSGGCSLPAVDAICTGGEVERERLLPLLSSLVNKSLIVADTLQRGEALYSLLETIRQYAQEKLLSSREWEQIHDRHLQYFLRSAEEVAPKLRGQYQQLWLDWLEGEYDNIRAALTWSLESGHIEEGLRISNAIFQFWTIRDYTQEGLAWVERLLAEAGEAISPVVRANATAYASLLAGFRGNISAQTRYGHKAGLLAESAGDEGKLALAWALCAQAYGAQGAGDHDIEFALATRGIQLFRELGETYLLGVSLSMWSFTAMSLGKYGEARAMLDESLVVLRTLADPYRIAMALNFSGDLARLEQDYVKAETAYEESILLFRNIGSARDLASALYNLGHTCLRLGDFERAYSMFSESMMAQLAQQNAQGVAECLFGFAAMAAVCDLPAAGARLLAAAVTIAGERVVTAWAATHMEYEHYLALLRTKLTETEFNAEQVVGRTLSLEQAAEYAQNLPLKAAARMTRKKHDELTVREREIAELIGQGKSNFEIAGQLVVSKRTVETHVGSILSKLGFTQRAQIVRWAIQSGLAKSNE